MKTIYYPKNSKGNPYVSTVYNAIEDAGYEVYDLPDLKKGYKFAKSIEIINLNWFDSIAGCGMIKAIALLFRQMLRIIYYKLMGMKIIYTLHNRQAHDTKFPRINKCLMRFLSKKADKIVVLCNYSKRILSDFLTDEEIEEKVTVIYLPNYIDVYPNVKNEINELPQSDDRFKILFFGYIRPYKNIEIILEVAEQLKEKKIDIVLAGRPYNDVYKEEILSFCKDELNIFPCLRFIKDEEVTTFFDWADVVVLPLSLKSSLNSSSAILAFSMKCTVISPLVGTLMDIPNQEDLFTYKYKDESFHSQALLEEINHAYSVWQKDSKKIKEMGENLYNYVKNNNSYEQTLKRYKELYDELV